MCLGYGYNIVNYAIVLVFYCCDKIPEKNQLEEERLVLAICFKGFNLWPAGSIVSGPEARKNMVAEEPNKEGSSPHDIWEAERESEQRV